MNLKVGDTVWVPWCGWITIKEVLTDNLTHNYTGTNDEGLEYYLNDRDYE